ncbi:MAG TPA: radical SAM protein [Firmicutes bacterium]|nr:radical SAM protein [Candidatus Fermentithermobacillaceae bacterium]
METDRPKLLLVSAPHNFGWPWGQGNFYKGFYEYLGTGYLAAACKRAGIDVEILDAPFHGWGPDRTAREIKSRRFDVLGISANWQEFFPQCAALLRLLSDVKAPIILGGHFPTIARKELLRDFPVLSAICVGEGEVTLVEAMERLASRKDLTDPDLSPWLEVPGLALRRGSSDTIDVHETPRRPMVTDLDSLPFPLRPQAEMYRASKNPGAVMANILSSRGCGGTCTFCTIHAFQATNPGPRWRARSPENTVDEMELLQKDYGFTSFRFVDEDFFGRCEEGRARAEAIAREIIKRGIKARLEIYCRADEVDPDILRILSEAGLASIYLSLDAVSESDIELYGKGTTRKQMVDSLRYVLDSGLEFGYSFIFWHPYRKVSEIREAFDLLDEAAGGDPKTYSRILKGMQTGIISDLVVLTGSPLEERIRRDGLLKGDYMEYSYDFVDPSTAAAYALVKGYKKVRNTAGNIWNSLFRPKTEP